MQDFTTLKFEKDANTRVATVTLDRPDKLNAFDFTMCTEFAEVWKRVIADDAINAVVIRSTHERVFSSGIDLKALQDPENPLNPTDEFNVPDPGEFLCPKANKCWKPVICAVNGLAVGGAFYWINESDIVICSDDAQFFDPHVTHGLVTSLEPIGAMAKMPMAQVLRMVLMGDDERISAQTALQMGLVTEVVPADRLHDRAREIAEIVAAKPSVTLQGSIKAIWQSLDMPRSTALETAIKYCQIGLAKGTAEVAERGPVNRKDRRHTVR